MNNFYLIKTFLKLSAVYTVHAVAMYLRMDIKRFIRNNVFLHAI